MKSLKALENADTSLDQTLTVAESSNSFANKEIDRKVRSLTLEIKKELHQLVIYIMIVWMML